MDEIRELLEKSYYMEGGFRTMIDATEPNVEPPEKYKNDTHFEIDISKFRIPTRQSIKFEKDYFSVRLVFDGKIHDCKFPYPLIRKNFIKPGDINQIEMKELEEYYKDVEKAFVIEQDTGRGLIRVSLLNSRPNFIEIYVSGNNSPQIIPITNPTLCLFSEVLNKATDKLKETDNESKHLV